MKIEETLSRLLARLQLGTQSLSLHGIGIACLALAGAGGLALAARAVDFQRSLADSGPPIEVATIDVADPVPAPAGPSPAVSPVAPSELPAHITTPTGEASREPPIEETKRAPAAEAPRAASAAASDRQTVPLPAATKTADAPPLPDGSRIGIAQRIQAGLKKAGCFEGRVTGAWTSKSRAAMQAFVETVNASLPVERADAVLLALIEANPDATCTVKTAPARTAEAKADAIEGPAGTTTKTPASAPQTTPAPQPTQAAKGPVPPVGIYERPRSQTSKRNTAKKSEFPPSKFAKSLMRNVQKAFADAF